LGDDGITIVNTKLVKSADAPYDRLESDVRRGLFEQFEYALNDVYNPEAKKKAA
jgi:hypothetical protein